MAVMRPVPADALELRSTAPSLSSSVRPSAITSSRSTIRVPLSTIEVSSTVRPAPPMFPLTQLKLSRRVRSPLPTRWVFDRLKVPLPPISESPASVNAPLVIANTPAPVTFRRAEN